MPIRSPRRWSRPRTDTLVAAMSNACYDQFWADPPTLARHVERLGAVYAEMLARRGVAIESAALNGGPGPASIPASARV